MATDLDAKKTFLQQGSALYAEMIKLSPNDVIRRYLAFRIIINAMSFEDLIHDRQEPRMRKIRNVLLAHKQEDDFFEGQQAAGEITHQSIAPLLARMEAETTTLTPNMVLAELAGGSSGYSFSVLVPQILQHYNDHFHSGFRVINNFLCLTQNAVHEISRGDLPGVFYRYHSSKALYDLSEYLFNNCYALPELAGLTMHTKLDMILHAQNMADSAIKDTKNSHSIDGLLEVMVSSGIGDPSPLYALKGDATFRAIYGRVRYVRNKLIGHMDGSASMADLIAALNGLPATDHIDLVNIVDKAVHGAATSDTAIWARYITGNAKFNDSSIVSIAGRQPPPYYI